MQERPFFSLIIAWQNKFVRRWLFAGLWPAGLAFGETVGLMREPVRARDERIRGTAILIVRADDVAQSRRLEGARWNACSHRAFGLDV
jgi:hypothetical protein